jgi:small subunit ribosomal protein S5
MTNRSERNERAPRPERGGERSERRPRRERREREEEREELEERVVDISRVAKVVKGGRRFAFRTVVIVGDKSGRVGLGIGKARGVPDSIRKGTEQARKRMIKVELAGTTIPHQVVARHGGAMVMLRPASPGTGVIAGGSVRAVLEAVGVRDVLSKSQGSNNLLNVALATLKALKQLKSVEEIARIRGMSPDEVQPFWLRRRTE